MSEIDVANRLVKKAEKFRAKIGDTSSFVSYKKFKHKTYDKYMRAVKIYERYDMKKDAGYAYSNAAEIAENSFKDYHTAIQHYKAAGDRLLFCQPKFTLRCYIFAFRLYLQMDDLDGSDNLTEYIEKVLPKCKTTPWLMSEYYEHIIKIFENSKDLDPEKFYLNKYHLKLAENVFSLKAYKWSLKIFKQIVLNNIDDSSQKDLVTRCCVCGCQAAILCKEKPADKKLKKICKLYEEFGNSFQYFLLYKIMEYKQNKEIEELEEAVKKLGLYDTNIEFNQLFLTRVIERIEKENLKKSLTELEK